MGLVPDTWHMSDTWFFISVQFLLTSDQTELCRSVLHVSRSGQEFNGPGPTHTHTHFTIIWNGAGTLWPGTGGWSDMDSLETEECSVVERPGTGVQTFFWRLHLFTRYFWLNSLYIYKIWYKDCFITCHQQNSKIQRELELRMTGGHPDSLTSA